MQTAERRRRSTLAPARARRTSRDGGGLQCHDPCDRGGGSCVGGNVDDRGEHANIKADNATPATITVQARDQYGNVRRRRRDCHAHDNLGHFGSIGAVTTVNATDLGNGTYTAQLFSSRSGTATITGTVAGTAITTPAATVKVTALPPAAIILVSGGNQEGTVGATLSAPAIVMVKSAAGFPLPDVSVTFSPPTGASVGTATATTDAGGRASSTLTLGTGPGAQSFGAIVGNLSVTIPENAVVGPASPTTSTISANVAQINADNAAPAVITVHAKDQYGNVIATGGATVTLTTNLGHWSGGPATTTTATDSDNGSYTATLVSAQSGTITISGAIGGTPITTPSVTIAAIPAVVDHFDVTLANGSPISGNQPSGVAISVKITARDVSGNIVTGYHGQPIVSITNSTLVGGAPAIVAPAAVSGVSAATVKFGTTGSNVTLDATDGTKVGHSSAFTVVVGPAVAIVPSDGDSTIVNQLGQAPSHYPILTTIDGLGNRVANQTVTLAVTPPCTLQASQLTTNAQGMIVLDASKLTIPTTGATSAFSCELVATGVGFTAPPLRLALVARTAASTVWTGRIDDKWETHDNWAVDLPSASLSAFIAAAQSSTSASYPVVRSSPTILSIDVEDRARVNLNGNTLTVLPRHRRADDGHNQQRYDRGAGRRERRRHARKPAERELSEWPVFAQRIDADHRPVDARKLHARSRRQGHSHLRKLLDDGGCRSCDESVGECDADRWIGVVRRRREPDDGRHALCARQLLAVGRRHVCPERHSCGHACARGAESDGHRSATLRTAGSRIST